MALVQRFGFDYEETFASIAKMTFVCTLIAVASINPRNLSQMDVKNTFINEDVNEEVYISLPLVFSIILGRYLGYIRLCMISNMLLRPDLKSSLMFFVHLVLL